MLSAHTHTQTLPRDGRSESSVTSRTSKDFEEARSYHCRIVEILKSRVLVRAAAIDCLDLSVSAIDSNVYSFAWLQYQVKKG